MSVLLVFRRGKEMTYRTLAAVGASSSDEVS